MSRKLFLLAAVAFLASAVAFGIADNWTFVFVTLAIGLGCVAVALLGETGTSDEDVPGESPAS